MFKESYSLQSPMEEGCTPPSFLASVVSNSAASSSSGSVTSSYSGKRSGDVSTVVVSTQTEDSTNSNKCICLCVYVSV